MKLQIKAWLKNGHVFRGSRNPDTESYFRISYDFTEGRPMKWGATMEDAEPEEPADARIYQVDLSVGKKQWANVTDRIDASTRSLLEVIIEEGGLL